MTTAETVLTTTQVDAFWADGYLCLQEALTPLQLTSLTTDFDTWVEQSRNHTEPFGSTIDGRARFDLEVDHTADKPALRRVASPIEVSAAYLAAMRNNRALDAVAQLIGPNIEFNNAKINSKQPGSATHVKYHQDFMFQPHSNQDLIAVLFFIDEVSLENGPLQVVPGSHHGPLFDHWHDGAFTGAVDKAIEAKHIDRAVPITGQAGAACLMHTRLLHGSAPNSSEAPRTLFIAEYRAEDSKPLQVNHLPSKYQGEVVSGQATNRVRCSSYEMEFPEVPTGASFFSQQAKADARQAM